MNKVFNVPNVLLMVLALACLAPCIIITMAFESLSGRIVAMEEKINQPPAEYYSIKLDTPAKGDVTNPYYEGFSRDYGDGKKHPHRQALMLLLTHLASQAERPTTTNETSDQKFKENK